MAILLSITILAAIPIGLGVLLMYSVVLAIGHKNKTVADAWEYWESHKCKSWNELTKEEKDEILIACIIIEDDCGGICLEEKLKTMLQEQLPIIEPNVGLTHYCKV